LRYGPDTGPSPHANRVQHVQHHALDDLTRNRHEVFNTQHQDVLEIVDEAWLSAQRGGSHVQVTTQVNRMIYDVDMGRPIGYAGGQEGATLGNPVLSRVRIIVQNGNEVVTAYPVQ
jgi:hypothetical protein